MNGKGARIEALDYLPLKFRNIYKPLKKKQALKPKQFYLFGLKLLNFLRASDQAKELLKELSTPSEFLGFLSKTLEVKKNSFKIERTNNFVQAKIPTSSSSNQRISFHSEIKQISPQFQPYDGPSPTNTEREDQVLQNAKDLMNRLNQSESSKTLISRTNLDSSGNLLEELKTLQKGIVEIKN